MRIGLLLLVSWMAMPSLYAQEGRHCRHVLYGVVTDSETLEPLMYAKVFVRELNMGAFTDEQGEFRLENLCDGPLTLSVSHIACGSTDYDLEIEENTHFDISLPHSLNHIDTVHIVDHHAEPRRTQGSSTLEGRELEEVRGKSLGEALVGISGISALQTGPSIFKPVIHGLHSNRVLVLNNGIRQEGQQWGQEHGPEIDPFVAERLTVVKGAAGVRYGPDAIAGVVLVEPAELPDSIGISGAAHLVGMSNGRMGATSAQVQGKFARLEPFSWRLQGTLKRGGNVHTPTYYLGNTGLSEQNFSAAAGWEKEKYGLEVFYSQFNSDIGIFTGAHIGNLTDLETAIERGNPLETYDFSYDIGRPYQHIVHELSQFKGHVNTGAKSELEFSYARQYNLRQEYDKHRPRNDSLAALDLPELHYEVTTHSGELIWKHGKWNSFKGEFGVTGQLQKNTYEGYFLIPNYRAMNAGAFAIERFVRLRWELEAGIRYDVKNLQAFFWENNVLQTPEFNWANLSGTVGGLLRISPHLRWSANFGTAWRPPQVNELFSDGLHHGTASIEVGDPNLRPEQAYNFITTLNYSEHEKFSSELSLYHNYIDNFIYLQPTFPPRLTIRGSFPTFEYQQVDARMVGADAFVSFALIDHLTLEAKGSVLRARNLTTDDFLILMPPDQFSGELRYEWTDRGNLVNPYVSAEYQFNRRQNRAPENQDYAPTPDAYGLVNIEAGAEFLIGKQKIDVGFSVLNAANVRYRNYLNRLRYYSDEMGRNYVLRLRIPFEAMKK